MGKKSEKLKAKLSQNKRNELVVLADAILVASRQTPTDVNSEFEIYNSINLLLEKIMMIEKEIKPQFKTSRSEDAIETFISWCKENGAKFPKIELKNLQDYGLGLVAKEPLKKEEVFIEIPESMIFSFNKIQEQLPEMLRQRIFYDCPLFDNMSHIRLTFALIIEKLNGQSKWKPYLDILPEKFRTVLYFTPAEMKELQGTMAFSSALKQVKFIATQYAFLYKYLIVAIENHPVIEELQNSFTYEFYRWAVSIICTRQNVIPQEDGSKESVLIPLWDMANHVNGIINTQYNDETHQIESFCLKDFDVNQHVTMAYGNRSNEQFLIHNGFVYPENENKDLSIKLSLSKSDELYNDRVELLKKINLPASGSFQISQQFSSELLGFVRVFNMTKDQLQTWHNAENTKDLLNPETPLDVAFQKKIIQFLLIRVKILLKAFPTTLDDDKVLLENGGLSRTKQMLVQYRILEKTILNEVLATLEDQIKLF